MSTKWLRVNDIFELALMPEKIVRGISSERFDLTAE